MNINNIPRKRVKTFDVYLSEQEIKFLEDYNFTEYVPVNELPIKNIDIVKDLMQYGIIQSNENLLFPGYIGTNLYLDMVNTWFIKPVKVKD